jgi:hypothetical protein
MLREESLETEKITVKKHAGGGTMEKGREREKHQVNLPKTRSTVEDKKSPLTSKSCHF